MKNIFYSFLIILALWGGFSCNNDSFLGETVVDDLDSTRVFTDSTLIFGFLFDIYRDVGFDVRGDRFSDYSAFLNPKIFGGIQTATDEAQYRRVAANTTDIQFSTGTVNPVIIADDAWKKPWENIRKVNVFFKGIKDAPLRESLKNRYRGEARFLRAWYYSIMLKHYGGVPIVGDEVFNPDDNLDLVRQTYDSCVTYIVKECEKAIQEGNFPDRYNGSEYGRVGAGACKALISRVKLWAASPLFNGNEGITDAADFPLELIGYPEYSAERWKGAMDAAQELIGTYLVGGSNTFSLYEQHRNTSSWGNGDEPGYGFFNVLMPGEENLGGRSLGVYDEALFEDRGLPNINDGRSSWYLPPSRSGVTNCGYPFQELVDAFPMADGTKFDWNNNDHAEAPFENRDPRLRNTVLYDGVPMAITNATAVIMEPVNIYVGGGEDAVYVGTPTGYYVNKGIYRYQASNTPHSYVTNFPLIRFAEILLNYAEAYNEYMLATKGDATIDHTTEYQTYGVLKRLRRRGGINNGQGDFATDLFGLKAGMTRIEMRQAIRDERQLELAFEGHRFWDVRRWKIAEEIESRQMYGMEVTKNADGTKSYKRFPVGSSRVFRKSMYFWPLPYREIIKSPSLTQNPNYNI